MPILPREEYIEQAYLFKGLNNRLDATDPVQTVMKHLRDEILATTKLPMAIDFILAELSHVGLMATAMQRLGHYFAPFQAFVIAAGEEEVGRFDMRTAFAILEYEARFRAEDVTPVSLFLYQFESICENHLDYDYGLSAMAKDPIYDTVWHDWILAARRKIGMVGLADLIYVHSEYYAQQQERMERSSGEEARLADVVMFGEREGRIALANRKKDPKYLFSALQRQIGYPKAPRPQKADPSADLIPKMVRQLERFESRLKMLEDEGRAGSIDLNQFYKND